MRKDDLYRNACVTSILSESRHKVPIQKVMAAYRAAYKLGSQSLVNTLFRKFGQDPGNPRHRSEGSKKALRLACHREHRLSLAYEKWNNTREMLEHQCMFFHYLLQRV